MVFKTQDITITRAILTSPTQVYAAFTRAEGWCEWCCEKAEVEAYIGGNLHIYTEGYHAYGEFTELEQDRIVAFTWNGDREPPTHIHILLNGQGNSTIMIFKVTCLGSNQDCADIADFFERIWGHVLDNLKAVLENKPET